MSSKELQQQFARIVDTDPVVHQVMMGWRAGDFSSLEEALIAAVVAQTEVKGQLIRQLEKALGPPPDPVILTVFGK